MNKLQLYMLIQDAVLQLKTNGRMQMSRMSVPARTQFKAAVGLKKNATAQQVLNELGRIYFENGIGSEFVDKVTALKGEQWIDKALLEQIQLVSN